ncbi:MAG: YdeI/OmpD-associated family protein [Gemmatirosa sp.]|nr:YdeI/OmpD-associated family protein [Gemmatirosa sp.]
MSTKAVYFTSPAKFGAWLAANHATTEELLVGFHKRHTARPSMTWAESVDEALCYGWIDGVRRSVDEDRYTIRFSPRRAGSTWSAVNVKRVGELAAEGRMQPAGLAAFERRTAAKSGTYSYENRPHSLEPDDERAFREHPAAWTFFEAQPPGYRRTAVWWIVSAKKADTRARRLEVLIGHSARGERLPALASPGKKRAE